MENVIIYTSNYCMYCNKAKQFFKDNNINFTEKNVSNDFEARKELIKKLKRNGTLQVPAIEINGDLLVGFNEDALRDTLGI